MSLRTRMLLAFGVMVLIPLALLAIGLRQEMTRRLSEEDQVRVDRVVEVIREDLHRERTGSSQRSGSLKCALLNDYRFRLAAAAAGRLRSSVVSPSTRPFLHVWPVIERSLCRCSIPEVDFPRIPPRKPYQPRPVTPTPQSARSRFP